MNHEDMSLIDYGLIDLDADSASDAEYLDRILLMRNKLDGLIGEFSPDVVILENLFLSTFGGKASKGNVETFKKLAKLLGVLEVHMLDNDVIFATIMTGVWRTGLNFGKKRIEQKKRSIELANELYGLELKWISDYSGKNDDDISDAILMCRYGCKIAEEVVKSKKGE